jgi:hypothetical protein
MRIMLRAHPEGDGIDITGYLDDESDVILTEEKEWEGFKRAYDDVSLRLSNLSGFFTTHFASYPSTQLHMITIEDGSRVWRGFVDNPSVKEEFTQEWCTLDVFSVDKVFWDRAKSMYIDDQDYVQFVYRSLSKFLNDHILKDIFRDLFVPNDFNIETFYADRILRGWADNFRLSIETRNETPIRMRIPAHGFTTGTRVVVFGITNYQEIDLAHLTVTVINNDDFTLDGTTSRDNDTEGGWVAREEYAGITNRGRFRELDKKTTVGELLEAFSLKYNAQIFIDQESQKFSMRRRGAAYTGVVTTITDDVLDDEEIEISPFDDEKYDYLLSTFYVIPPSGFLYYIHAGSAIEGQAIHLGNLQYVVTAEYGENFETGPSEIIYVDVRSFSHGVDECLVLLALDAFDDPHITGRRIYRKEESEGNFYYVTTVPGSDYVQWLDTWRAPDRDLSRTPPPSGQAARAWFRFDESEGVWDAPILDVANGDNKPSGRIFDAIPKLRFHEIGHKEQIKDESYFDTWCFFGREGHIDRENYLYIQNQFLDLMVAKKKGVLSLKGTGYRPGDELKFNLKGSLSILNSGSYVIRKARRNLTQERTKVELVKLVA